MEGLKNIIKDQKRLLFAGNFDKKYLSDGLEHIYGNADALVFPTSAKEVSQLLKYAYDKDIQVTPRGAGTNLSGSTIPSSGIIVDLSLMNNILELDKETFTVTVEPGVMLSDLQKYVEAQGLFYPPDPGEKESTIGGNIATNAGGMRAVKYGVTRDYVQELEVVLADGKVVTLGSKNIKDSSGLPLKHLLIGSEGTLGIITKCVLKLIPLPQHKRSIVIGFHSMNQAIHAVHDIIADGSDPTAIEFVQRSIIELGEEYTNISFPFQDSKAYLILTYDGNSLDNLEVNIEKARVIAERNNCAGFKSLDDADEEKNIWTVRGSLLNAVEAKSQSEPMDIVVPINKITQFVEYIQALESETGVRMIAFGHAGDGNVHLCVIRDDRDDETWKKELDNVLTNIYDKSHSLGGLPSGEHGIGIYKQKYFKALADAENIRIMQQIKSVFDPKGLLNSGKVFF